MVKKKLELQSSLSQEMERSRRRSRQRNLPYMVHPVKWAGPAGKRRTIEDGNVEDDEVIPYRSVRKETNS